MTLAVVAALLVATYVYFQLDQEIRKRVERTIAAHYGGLRVHVASARVVDGQGIEIRGVSIIDPTLEGPVSTLVTIDELFASCATNLTDFAQGGPRVCRLTIRRPKLRAVRRADGTWSVARLLPLPKFGRRSPPVVVEQAVVEVFKPGVGRAAASRVATFHDGNFRLTPARVRERAAGPGKAFQIEGTVAADFFQQATVEGTLEPDHNRWRFRGRADRVRLGASLVELVPAALVPRIPAGSAFRAQATVQFQVDNNPVRTPACQFALTVQLDHGRCEIPELPAPLTDLAATVRLDNQRLRIEDLTARCETATVRLSCQRTGWRPKAPMTLTVDVRNVMLCQSLFAALPVPLRGLWEKFRPAGPIHTAGTLFFDGTTWHPHLMLRLNGVAFTFYKFPYRLDRGTGTVEVKERRATFNLVAYGEKQPVTIQGDVVDPGPRWTGWARVRGRDVAIDERLTAPLIKALPNAGKGRQVVRSLHPRGGRFHFDWQCRRDDASRPKPCQQLDLQLVGGAIRYDKFPFPIDGVRGTVRWHDRRWDLIDLTGTNRSADVALSGHLVPTTSGRELVLDIRARDVPVDAELRGALRPDVRQVWDDLKPTGLVHLTAHVRHTLGAPAPDLTVVIDPVAEGASIQPIWFPLRLNHLDGPVTYQNGRVHWRDLRARHDRTRFSSAGQCRVARGGRWQLELSRLDVDRLRADRDLLGALPTPLRGVVKRLDPTGTVNMAGALALAQPGGPRTPVTSRWNLRFDMQQTDLHCGVVLKNLRGSIELSGSSDGQRFQTGGELALDSMDYHGFQVTGIHGPLWADPRRVLFGTWVSREQRSAPRHVTAQLNGGALSGDGWIALGDQPRFALQGTLTGGDLRRFAQATSRTRQHLKGKIDARITLQGTGTSVQALAGTGAIRLRDADIYELPVIVALLKVLNARLPNTTAFTESDMQFRIQGDHLYFEQLNLMGDAVSLYGKGTVDLQRNLHLVFHSNFRRSDLPMPLVRRVLGQASQQILQIHVDGSFDNPRIRNEPLPLMNQALQQIQADLGAGVPASQRPTAWRWPPWNPPATPR